MIHHFFNAYKVEKEIFEFPSADEFMAKHIGELIHHLSCHNIDATFYKTLEEVPLTDKSIVRRNVVSQISLMNEGILSTCEPRNYQSPIIEKMIQYFGSNERGCLFLPPGIGKTYITMFFLQRSPAMKKILILTPQILICDEFTSAFERVFGSSKRLLVFNSEDESVTERKDLNMIDDIVINTTYQTFTKHREVFPNTFDIVIYDEAHHLATSQTFQDSLECKGRKLFLTATPVIVDTQDDDDNGNFKTYSLDNEATYGKPIHHVSLTDAINDGHLCDYRLLVYPQIEDDKEEEHIESEIYTQQITAQTYINTLVNVYGRHTIVVFYNRCEDAKRACEDTKIDNCICHYIDGTMTKAQKQRVIEAISTPPSERKPTEKIQILFNVNIVGEGVSIDCINAILYMDARNTAKSLIQTIGRGLRLHPEKDCTIVCVPPSMVDTASIIASAIYIDTTYCKKDVSMIEKHILDRIITETSTIEAKMIILKSVRSTVKMIEISKNGGQSQYGFQICLEFERVTNKKITHRTVYKDTAIGCWLQDKKVKYNNEKLSEQFLKELDKLKTWRDWISSVSRNFNLMLQLCIEFEYKTNKKIQSTTIYKNSKIGCWIHSNKSSYNNGKLSEERLKELDKLKTWRDWLKSPKVVQLKFKNVYEISLTFERKTNKKITSQTIYNGIKIGKWFTRQRSLFMKNKLSEEKLKDLRKLSSWSDERKRKRYNFNEMLQLCIEFKHNVNQNITDSTVYKNLNIGKWYCHKKEAYKNGSLSDEHLQKLSTWKTWQDWQAKNSVKRRKVE